VTLANADGVEIEAVNLTAGIAISKPPPTRHFEHHSPFPIEHREAIES
jgi:hypothetical protein